MSLWLSMAHPPPNRAGLNIMVGMDLQQFIIIIISGISALATVVAAIYTRRQAIGSKEAKAKAEESHKATLDMRDAAVRSADAAEKQARQSEKFLEQKEQVVTKQPVQLQPEIAASLWRPEFQLTHVQGSRYKLQNISEHSLDVLKVVNQDEFFRCDDIHQQFNPGESLDILLGGAWGIPLPSNLILQVADQDELIYVQIPAKSG